MDNIVMFESGAYGFDREQVADHFTKMITEYARLEKKYLLEKQKNMKLQAEVQALKQARLKGNENDGAKHGSYK